MVAAIRVDLRGFCFAAFFLSLERLDMSQGSASLGSGARCRFWEARTSPNGYHYVRAKHPGKILKQLLEAIDMSSAELAAHSRLAPDHVAKILSGAYRIRPLSAVHLAQAFDVAPWHIPAHWLRLQDDFECKREVADVMLPKRPSMATQRGQRIDPEVREQVLELVGSGLSSEEAGAVVGLGKMSVAGIRAADTKGQYE